MTKILPLHSQNVKQVTAFFFSKSFCALVDDQKVSTEFQGHRNLLFTKR